MHSVQRVTDYAASLVIAVANLTEKFTV